MMPLRSARRLGVDEVELDLDPEGGAWAGGERIGAHGRVLPSDSASKMTLCARTLAPMTSACSSMSK